MNEFKVLTTEEFNNLSKQEQDEYNSKMEELNKKRYLELTNNNDALEDLKSYISARQQGYIPMWATGFHKLDEALAGGFMGEQLIFLGAISSLGKTSLALQIGTQIAEQGRDVLIFSLEMSKNELNAKTISRYSYIQTKNNNALQKYRLNTRDVLNGNVGELAAESMAADDRSKVFLDAYNATAKLSDHLRIFVGNNDIDVDKIANVVDTHIKALGEDRKPFVICDYLQILRPSTDAQTTDKRLLTDYDVTRLKVISRNFHIPVMVISAFNRTSYLEPVSMSSFRESSGIEYSSDVLLAMQYDGMDYQKHWFRNPNGKAKKTYESDQVHKTRVRELFSKIDKDNTESHGTKAQKIELKILKNRTGSRGSLYYDFIPAYNYYEEANTDTSRYELTDQEWRELTGDMETPFSGGKKAPSVVSSDDNVAIGDIK